MAEFVSGLKNTNAGIPNGVADGNGVVGGLSSGGGRDTLLRRILVGPLEAGANLAGSGRGKIVLVMALSPLEENYNESERVSYFEFL